MAGLVFILCAITALVCFGLLLRGYRITRTRLLLWSSFCFLGLTIDNILLFLDRFVVTTDLSLIRMLPGLCGLGLLLYGLVWEDSH